MVLDGFVRALDGFEAVLAGVAPDRWDALSPCAGWYAVDVAGHVSVTCGRWRHTRLGVTKQRVSLIRGLPPEMIRWAHGARRALT